MKIPCWNMGAAYGFKGTKHAAAGEWLNAQDADVAMLQEVMPRGAHLEDWKAVTFAGKWQNWDSAVLARLAGTKSRARNHRPRG